MDPRPVLAATSLLALLPAAAAQQPPATVPAGQPPPAQAPPAQVPPAQVPPGQIPPAQVPPDKLPPGQIPALVPYGDPLGPGKGLELTLEAAIALALENNLGLKIEQLSTEVAFYDLNGSWGAFDWQFSAGASYEDREFQSSSVFGGSEENTQAGSLDLVRPIETGGQFAARFTTTNQETDSTFAAQSVSTTDILSVSYKQPLLRGAWREYATAQQRQADLSWKRQSEHEREIRHRLIREVSDVYWDLVLARAQLEVSRTTLELARAQLDQDQRRLANGIGIELDVFAAETEVARNEERVLNSDVRVRQVADELKLRLFPGTDMALWETMLVPSSALPENPTAAGVPEWTAALAVAIERRAELRQQRLAVEQAELNYSTRDNERDGALDLELTGVGTGFDGESETAFDSAASFEFPTWRAALTYSIPLSNKTARNAAKAAWANLRSTRLVYDQTETAIAAEVRDAVRQVIYQAEAVRAASKSLELAERQLEAEQKRRQDGISTNFEVLRLQRDLSTALTNERLARVSFAKAQVALKAAQGLLAESPAP